MLDACRRDNKSVSHLRVFALVLSNLIVKAKHVPSPGLDGLASVLQNMRRLTKKNLFELSDLELTASVRFAFELSLCAHFLAGPEENGKIYLANVALENKRHLEKDIDQLEYELSSIRVNKEQRMNDLRHLTERALISEYAMNPFIEIPKLLNEHDRATAKRFSIY